MRVKPKHPQQKLLLIRKRVYTPSIRAGLFIVDIMHFFLDLLVIL